MIINYNDFEERKVISYDFDGVLHTSVIPGTIDPIDYIDWESWKPSKKIHKLLISEHKKGNRIIVISARGTLSWDFENEKIVNVEQIMWQFIMKYDLPVDELILTGSRPKKKHLIKLKAVKHYDDNFKMIKELKDVDIDFVWVQNDEIMGIYNKVKKI